MTVQKTLTPGPSSNGPDPMKSTAFVVSVLAILIAAAGVAGYAVVAHGSLPFTSAPASANGMGTLNVFVTSTSPGNETADNATASNVTWSHVYVTFTVIQAEQANDSNNSGWHNMTVSSTIDLMSVKTVSALLGSTQLPAGQYNQLRIVVVKAWGVTSTEKSYDFRVPSGDLKTDDPFTVTTGQTASITLDVNTHIVWTDSGYVLTPVLGSVAMS